MLCKVLLAFLEKQKSNERHQRYFNHCEQFGIRFGHLLKLCHNMLFAGKIVGSVDQFDLGNTADHMTDRNDQDRKSEVIEMFCPFAFHVSPDTVTGPGEQFLDRIYKTFVQMKNAMHEVVQKEMFQRKAMRGRALPAIWAKVAAYGLMTV